MCIVEWLVAVSASPASFKEPVLRMISAACRGTGGVSYSISSTNSDLDMTLACTYSQFNKSRVHSVLLLCIPE